MIESMRTCILIMDTRSSPCISAGYDIVHPAEKYIQAAESFRNQTGGDEASTVMYEKANDLSGGRYNLLSEEAKEYAMAHHYQKAMDTMNRSIKLGGDHPSLYMFMGM